MESADPNMLIIAPAFSVVDTSKTLHMAYFNRVKSLIEFEIFFMPPDRTKPFFLCSSSTPKIKRNKDDYFEI